MKYALGLHVFIMALLIGFFCTDPVQPKYTYPPKITDKEVKTSGSKVEGFELTMYVLLDEGDTPVNYQWFKNNTALAADTTDTLYFAQLETSHNGEYRCVASNKHGTDTTQIYTLLVFPDTTDTAGPIIQIISPPDSSVTSQQSLPISFKVKDKSGIVAVSVNGTSVFSQDSLYLDTITLDQDTNTVTIGAIDSNANSSTLKLTYIYNQEVVDTVAPVIILISPLDSSTTNDSLLQVSFKVTDQSGLASVSVNGTLVSSSDSIYTQNVKLILGQNLVKFIAEDASSQKNRDSLTVIFYYDPTWGDTTGPDIQLLSPQNGAVTSDSTLKITFKVTDPSGVSLVSVNGFAVTSVDSIYIDTVSLSLGSNSVTISALDNASTQKNSDTLKAAFVYDPTFTDTAGPDITILSPAHGDHLSSNTVSVTVNVEDISGVAWVTINGDTAVLSGNNYVKNITLTPGSNSIKVLARDNSTKQNVDSSTIQVTHDNVKPSMRLVNPNVNNTSVITDSVVVQVVAKDNIGIKDVRFSVGVNTYPTTVFEDTIYYATIKNLVQDIFTEIKVSAVDTAANDSIMYVNVKYDPTAADTVGPQITIVSPIHGAHVNSALVDVTVKAEDPNGVAWVTVNGENAVLTGSNYVKSVTLTPGKNSIMVRAQDNSSKQNVDSSLIQITFDNIKPTVRLIDPSLQNSSVKTDSVVLQVIAHDNIGINDVKFTVGVTIYPTTVFEDTIFYATIKNLVQDIFTNIEVSVTDTATNDSTMYVNIKYDPSLNDADPPVITQLSGPANGQRVTTAQHTFTFTITDQSGVDSALYTLDDVFQDSLLYLGSNEFEFTHNFGTSYGQRTIRVYAIDNTSNQNQSFKIIQLNYNTVVSAVTNSAPAQGAVNVEMKPTFSWTGGDDPDGDAVTFKVYYGTASNSLIEVLDAGTNKTVQPTGNLTAGIQYFWKVTAYSAAFPVDSVSSTVTSFTTWRPLGMRLIEAKGQSFNMGTAFPDFYPYEAPVHTVSFTKDFWMDTTEVIQKVYSDVMTAAYAAYIDPVWSDSFGVGASYPTYYVGWFDAVAFCNALSNRDGFDTVYSYTSVTDTIGKGCRLNDLVIDLTKNGYRLPTEAEWEYACRAGTVTWFYWGDIIDGATVKQYCWYELNAQEDSWTEPHAFFEGAQHVATRLPNNFGLYDMCGNVAEWVNDWYLSSYYSESPDTDPPGPATGGYKVIRGGEWRDDKNNIRSACRVSYNRPWWDHYEQVGFRVVLPVHDN